MSTVTKHNPRTNTSNRYRHTSRKQSSLSTFIITHHFRRTRSMFSSHIIRARNFTSNTRTRRIITNRRHVCNKNAISSISLLRSIRTCIVTQVTSNYFSRRAIRLHLERFMNTRLFSKILDNSSRRQLQCHVNFTISNSFLLFRSLRRYKLHF